jgi:large subunit ribosomal protein L32
VYTGPNMVNHMRHTHSQSAERRSHHALIGVRVTLCESCGSPKMNHRACVNCGKYNKREVLNVYKALDKKAKKTSKTEKVAKK